MAALCVLLLAACGYDYKSRRIPNYLVLTAAFWGVLWRQWGEGAFGVASYLGQAVLVMALVYPLYRTGSFGAGDAKLLGVTAGYLPFGKILAFLFCSLLIAAIFSLVKMWKGKNFGERIHYLSGYLSGVVRSGSWHLYLENERDRQAAGICLSGPVFISILLYLGGVY